MLTDALNGGGDGPDLDALITALGGYDSGANALGVFPTHAATSALGWEATASAGYSSIHDAFDVQALVVYQDAILQA